MTYTESETRAAEQQLQIHSQMLQDGQQLTVSPDARLAEQDQQRVADLGIIGQPLASIEVGRQEFIVVDVRQSQVSGNNYRPMDSLAHVNREKSPTTYELDPEYPLVLMHVDQHGGLVGRAIRPYQPITLGREANKVDHKSGRFQYGNDATLSRQHVNITLDPERGLVVTDIHSTNGTKIRYGEKPSTDSPYETIPRHHVRPERSELPGRESRATSELMAMGEFFPQSRVEINNREFLISKIVHGPDRTYAVMYTTIDKDGEKLVVPRFLYRSNSDGGWRVAYGIDAKGRFIKEADEDEWHYTQETKLDPKILDQLDIAEITWDKSGKLENNLQRVFATNNGLLEETDARSEVTYYHDKEIDEKLKHLRHFSAGEMSHRHLDAIRRAGYRDFSHYLQSMDRVFSSIPGFMPDFRRPVGAEVRTHTMLGRITVEHFSARLGDEPITWSIASDSEGRVWVENVKLQNAGVTSYGTAAKVFDAGIATSKPIEYAKQSDGLRDMQERVPFQGKYHDITPVLDSLLPIREYRKARGIVRHRR